jgi:hypothetical protein
MTDYFQEAVNITKEYVSKRPDDNIDNYPCESCKAENVEDCGDMIKAGECPDKNQKKE